MFLVFWQFVFETAANDTKKEGPSVMGMYGTSRHWSLSPIFVLQDKTEMPVLVCMVITYYSKSKGQQSKVANSARGQLKRENKHFPFPIRAR